MRYLRAIFVLMGALFTSACSHNERDPIAKLDGFIDQFDSYLSSTFAESQMPGLAIAIVQNGRIVYMKGFGHRRVGEDDQIDANSVFRISSLSKGFASVLAGILVKQGLLDWDDRVEALLPGFSLKDSTNTKSLTIRHVLSHTSGLTSHAYDNLIDANARFEEITKKLKEAPVVCPVGKCYAYQNAVYSLIAPIIKTATGSEYEVMLTQRLLSPLGMHHASVNKEGLLREENIAFPHIRKDGKWLPGTIKDTYYQVQPAAGVNASVHDMAQWLCALVGGMPDIVPPDVVDEVTKPQVETPQERKRFDSNNQIRSAHYGMGWRIFDYAGHNVVFHSGGIEGYQSQLAFLPRERTGVVVLQNSWARSPFLFKFLDMYLSSRMD